MVQKKGSCLKRLVIGCGGVIGLVILLGALSTLIMFASRPEPSEYTMLDSLETFTPITEQALKLPGGDLPPPKPLRLKLDLRMVNFRLVPHDLPAQIRIESNYDKANFNLTSQVTEKKDHIEYDLRFRNKRNLLGMIAGTKEKDFEPEDINNKVTLYVPRDLLLELDFQIKMGSTKLNLSGLAVTHLKGRFSMGENQITMKEPNQVRMETLDLASEMGEMRLSDVQNFRYKEGQFKGRIGELEIGHSGPYQEDASLRVRMSMGGVRIQKPVATNLNQKITAMIGETSSPGEPFMDPEHATLSLAGRVTLGEFHVSDRDSADSQRSQLFDDLFVGDSEEVIDGYRLLIEQSPEKALGRGPLNSLGYDLLNEGETEKAIAIFKLNTELHSDYANGYDSLAEGYMKSGDIELAIANYERALAMDPDNSSATRNLKKLRLRLAGNVEKQGD